MSLENLTKGKSKISGGFRKRFLPLALTALVLSFGSIVGCKPAPGPISVENSVTPSVLDHGDTGYWKVKVTNYGGEVTLESASATEEIMNGEFEGHNTTVDIPLSVAVIPANSTETIASKNFVVRNTTYEDVMFRNIVTVTYDNGKTAEDTITYTIRSVYSDYSSPRSVSGNGLSGALMHLSE